ncbi:DUF1641 domain-containing protein [Achromobacter deleyi]|uniref:DUF1641 domain-containing protein n=1 Tax=Achromobacter deleyi TaxID=1353891 RepID=A0A7T4E262_9BURK|nr:DUF1641 domain-containing protein [Achromobacter deleyi]QQB32676.1 DUF1641 domain-containing protein [Achromobacter deleyi]
MNAPQDTNPPTTGQCATVFDAPPAANGGDALAQLADKLQPLADSGRLDNIVDLLALASDLVDLLDAPMVEKLGTLSEQVSGAAWTASNAWRMAQAQGMREAHPPGLAGLFQLSRDEDTRRGLALLLRTLQGLGRQLGQQRQDYAPS